MKVHWLQEPVKVDFHLDHGYTQVILERLVRMGLADGNINWDIPTNSIPSDLRTIGSRFLISVPSINLDEHDSIEDIRAACRSIRIYRLK